MPLRIGIITVRDSAYHPNRRLLEAARLAGHEGVLIHPYRLWPTTVDGKLGVSGENAAPLPQVVLPRQGAQIGDACLALVGQFQDMGVPLVNDFKAVATARNKFLTQQALSAAGLPCPDTFFVNDASGVFQAVDRLGGYPLVVKPVSARQGSGVLRIENADDCRRRALDALNRREGLMIQRYLPPEKRRDIRALVVGGEVICAAMLVPPPGEFRANFHLGADIRSIVLSIDLARTALAAAAAVGCAVAGVDMMVDGDGRPLIVEVNYSPGFKGMEAASGLDIADRIVAFAVKRHQQASR
jgi:ribosomal protein S6--L-glutamate ligase